MQSSNLPDEANSLFWAIIGYSRWWLSTDAPFLDRIAQNEGRLEIETASNIMTNYNVARGFENRASIEFSKAIEIVNSRALCWPDNLQERYFFCERLAKEWHAISATRNLQISAATKVMWFLRPQCWTMFDSYAAKGMGVSSAEQFYAALESNGFSGAVARLTTVITNSEWPSLPATKVIDFYLMRRGSFGGAAEMSDTKAYLQAMPDTARKSLFELATDAQDELGDEFLPAIARKRRSGK